MAEGDSIEDTGSINLLEKEEKPKQPGLISLATVIVWGIASGWAFGLPLSTLKPFIEGAQDATPAGLGLDASLYALCVGIYSAGEISGVIISSALPLTYGLSLRSSIFHVIGLMGCVLYSVSTSIYILLLGRYLTGIWTGAMNGLIRHWVATAGYKPENIKTIFYTIGTCIIGAMSTGPAIGSWLKTFSKPYPLDTYHLPGWFITFICVVSFFMTLFVEDKKYAAKSNTVIVQEKWWNGNNLPTGLIVVCVSMAFVFNIGWATLETMVSPVGSDLFGMDIETVGSVFFVVGILSFITMLLITLMMHYVKPKSSIMFAVSGLVGLFIGFLTLVDFQSFGGIDKCRKLSCSWKKTAVLNCSSYADTCRASKTCRWNAGSSCDSCAAVCLDPTKTLSIVQFYIGLGFINVFFPIGRLGGGALWAELNRGLRATTMQNLFVAVGALSRIFGPMLSVALYEGVVDHATWLVFGVGALISLIMLVWLLRLLPVLKENLERVKNM